MASGLAHRFYNEGDELLCTLPLCVKPTWSLVWRLIWHLTSDGESLEGADYHALLQQRPDENLFTFRRRIDASASSQQAQLTSPDEFDPGSGAIDEALLMQATDWIVRRLDMQEFEVTQDRPLPCGRGGSSSSSSSASHTSSRSRQSKASNGSQGSIAVKRLDGECCFSGLNRNAFLQGMHIFPRSGWKWWKQWKFGPECTAILDEQEDKLLDCVNNMLTGSMLAHKAWDEYELAVDVQADNRVLAFEHDPDGFQLSSRAYLRTNHRSPAERPLQLLLAHHLRQCFLALIPRSDTAGSRSMQSLSRGWNAPQDHNLELISRSTMHSQFQRDVSNAQLLEVFTSADLPTWAPDAPGAITASIQAWRLAVAACSEF